MPDVDGKLSAEEIQKIMAWLAKYPKAGNAVCPMCDSPNWIIGQHLVQPITQGPRAAIQLGGGVAYPQVMLISNPCGYTRLINAVVMGLMPGITSAPPDQKIG